ncbi:Pilus assembly protein TadE [Sphingobium herbicidovorans NBRC 16415]|jgi:Flp pilus assembly protein TadG|uniref:Pilus assembly protein TadE n=1 Tax=Sphingobium herbicidovorans (strain ATCC 700291 / DSM 11019 / CCUG 56400 / KCTC 2939 / LMG 18315 / NBRC 16415 / MH) TaxID=1219045 RepID=A0A086PC54_SPHHM|nr:TadE/TadG family type IV pilus assembly protein [Sphingobium herbicidovorans]KFG90972.1 Pilus assembly protein TadE [Sphingobium herbicidovorans NBRC 16415]
MAALEFALIAPALLMLVFAIIIYSFWFSALLGVRHAAAEGARAAMAGLSATERTTLAQARAQAVIDGYGALLSSGGTPDIQAQADGTGQFKVQVRYDMSGSPMVRYGGFIPLPSTMLGATVVVTNGSY